MGFQERNDKIQVLGIVGLIVIMFTMCQCKIVSVQEGSTSRKGENVFVSLAKSLATEAISEFQSSARRNPKLGFNITMLLPPNLNGSNNAQAGGGGGGGNSTKIDSRLPILLGLPGQIGLIGLKGGILGLKAAVIQTIVMILFIIFLFAGIVYFACGISLINCSNLGGGGGQWSNDRIYHPSSSNGYDNHPNLMRVTSSAYHGIDNGQKKYS